MDSKQNEAASVHAADAATPENTVKTFLKTEWGLAIAAVVIAWLGLQSTVFASDFGFGVTLTVLSAIAVTSIYLYRIGVKPRRESFPYLALLVAAAGLYAVGGAHEMPLTRFILLVALYAYWLCTASGTRSASELSPTAAFDVLYALFRAPFGGVGGTLRGMTCGARGKKTLSLIVLGLAAAVPLLIVVVSLLIGADAAFASAVSAFTGWFTFDFGQTLFRVLLIAFCALLLLSQWLRVLRDKSGAIRRGAPPRCIPHIVPCIVLSLLCLVYVAFFVAQTGSVSEVLRARREGFSYSDFARQGFFRLCLVCGINFCVVLIANYLTDEKRAALKILLTLLCVSTLLLTASAIFKMALYIGAYGLTPPRIVTSWFMLALAASFVCILISQWKNRVPVFKISALTLCVSFLVLCCISPARISANYNADAYLRGALKQFDYQSLRYQSPYAAADAVKRVYLETEDEALKSDLRLAFSEKSTLFTDALSLNLNIEKLRGAAMYRELFGETSAFLLRVECRAASEISGIHIEFFLDGTPVGGHVTVNADGTPLRYGDTLTFDFTEADFPPDADLTTFAADLFIMDSEGVEHAAGERLALAASYGSVYDFTLESGEGGEYVLKPIR